MKFLLKLHENHLNIILFPMYILFCILVGGFIGLLIEKTFRSIEPDTINSKIEALAYLIIQCLILGLILFFLIQSFLNQYIKFTNWSYGNFFFAISFFTVQTTIQKNLQMIFGL